MNTFLLVGLSRKVEGNRNKLKELKTVGNHAYHLSSKEEGRRENPNIFLISETPNQGTISGFKKQPQSYTP